MPECAKTHLQQCRISQFSGEGPPDPPGGKGRGREGKGKEGRWGLDPSPSAPKTIIRHWTVRCLQCVCVCIIINKGVYIDLLCHFIGQTQLTWSTQTGDHRPNNLDIQTWPSVSADDKYLLSFMFLASAAHRTILIYFLIYLSGHPTQSIVDLGFMALLLLLLLFRPLVSELAERPATRLELSAICKSMSEIWGIYPPPKIGPQNHFFRRFRNLIASLTSYIFRIKHDIHNRAKALETTRGLLR